MIALLVMTDGRRDCLTRTIESLAVQVEQRHFGRVIVHDDSVDPRYREWLTSYWESSNLAVDVIGGPERRGFGGSIRAAWEHCRRLTDERFIFHLEDDFTFNRPIDLGELASVLDSRPELVQMALRRQPWNDLERAAGGVVETNPDEYTEVDGRWLEHRLFFTTNPCLYRTELTWKQPWPRGLRSEGVFTRNVLRSPRARFGYWGARDSGEWVTHIGEERVGVGY